MLLPPPKGSGFPQIKQKGAIYEYIEDKYPEAIRVEEEYGEEIEVMDLLFFYDRKKLDEDAIRQRINFFASETKCEVRVIVIKFDDVSQ